MRMPSALATILFVAFAVALSSCHADQEQLGDNWKISFLDGAEVVNLGVLKLSTKGGKVNGILEVTPKLFPDDVKVKLHDVALQGEMLTVTVHAEEEPFQFVFKAPKGETKKLLGTVTIGTAALPALLESTKDINAKGLEPEVRVEIPKGAFKDLKEDLGKRNGDLGSFVVANSMLFAAVNEKVPAANLKLALVPVLEAARNHGNLHREVLLQFARPLANREDYAALSEEFAQLALKEFGDGAPAAVQLRCLDLIAGSMLKQNKKNDLAAIRTRIDAMEIKGHGENEKEGLGFSPAKFDGRKGKRVVLVELFTGAHCPPCVAADLAFEGLAKTYSNSEIVLLQYHLHIPAPDPLTTPDTKARADYYGENVKGTPSIFFSGKPSATGGGYKPHALAKYKEYRGLIDPLLAEDNKIALAVDAKRTGNNIAITATASGYKPADKLKLRLALIEPWVRYAGSNGLSYHAHVVRALPGGVAGFSLTKDTAKETAKVDLAELQEIAGKQLDQFPVLDGQRPFSYRNLRVVAFVQDDDSKEVLHAIEVPVK